MDRILISKMTKSGIKNNYYYWRGVTLSWRRLFKWDSKSEANPTTSEFTTTTPALG
jgi:hypothetical protein